MAVQDTRRIEVPPWLTCDSAADDRWSRLRELLSSPRGGRTEFHGKVLDQAQEIIASMSSEDEVDKLQAVKMIHKHQLTALDSDTCVIGYAIALYLAGVAADNVDLREHHRGTLLDLLGIGPGQTQDLPETMPLAWFLDMAGWPIPVAELVIFALGGAGSPVPRPTPLSRAAPPCPLFTAQLPTHTNALDDLPLGVCLVSSHMYAADAALALTAVLGEARRAVGGGLAPLRWYGYPQKFLRKYGNPDIVRLCSSQEPMITCGGPSASALDRLLELVTVGAVAASEGEVVEPGRSWPYNIWAAPGDGSLSWPAFKEELRELALHGMGLSTSGELLVCGYPSVACLALASSLYDRGVFVVAMLSGSVVEYAAPSLQQELWDLWQFLSAAGSALLCHSLFDEAHLAAAGLSVPRVALGARYMVGAKEAAFAATSQGVEQRQILVSRLKVSLGPLATGLVWFLLHEMAESRFPYRFVSYEVQYEYHVLGDFLAAVFVPWNWELITFQEWYALGLPVFAPGPEMMVPLILNSLLSRPTLDAAHGGAAWVNLRPEWSHAFPQDAWLDVSPDNVDASAASIARWLAQTDYAAAPHVRRFVSIADLLAQVSGCDFRAWGWALRATNERSRREAEAHYLGLVMRARGVRTGFS